MTQEQKHNPQQKRQPHAGMLVDKDKNFKNKGLLQNKRGEDQDEDRDEDHSLSGATRKTGKKST